MVADVCIHWVLPKVISLRHFCRPIIIEPAVLVGGWVLSHSQLSCLTSIVMKDNIENDSGSRRLVDV